MLGRAANLRHAAHEPSPSDANVILGAMGAPWGRVFRSGKDDRTHRSQATVPVRRSMTGHHR
jgi:hypothetical protein